MSGAAPAVERGDSALEILKRAGKKALDDNVPMLASALAYSSFFAIPSVMLVVLGLFTLFASADTIRDLMERLDAVMPAEATELLGDSLTRASEQAAGGILFVALGFVLAIWSVTGAMTTYMTALSLAYDTEDSRNFVKKRVVAIVLAALLGVAVLLVAFLLMFGPHVQQWLGDALGIESVFGWIWWIAQWPILVLGLLIAFAAVQYFAPDVEHRRWQLITPGAALSVVIWILASGAFAVYTSQFASYNKTWGSLSAVIVMLTWLWITGLALLFGGEVNAEVERSRKSRAPAE